MTERVLTAFQRLTEFAKRVIAVPKAEIDEQAKKYRRRRQRRRSGKGQANH